jgi:hypothetical protein
MAFKQGKNMHHALNSQHGWHQFPEPMCNAQLLAASQKAKPLMPVALLQQTVIELPRSMAYLPNTCGEMRSVIHVIKGDSRACLNAL